MRRGSSKDVSLLRFEFMLLTIHNNNEMDNEDEKIGSNDPCCLAGVANCFTILERDVDLIVQRGKL